MEPEKDLNENRMSYRKRVTLANSSSIQGRNRKTGECVEKELSKVENTKIFARNLPKAAMKNKLVQDAPPAMNSV